MSADQTSKNPGSAELNQIRLEVLKMAHADAMQRYQERLVWEADANLRTKLIEELPSPFEIIERANVLMVFLNQQ